MSHDLKSAREELSQLDTQLLEAGGQACDAWRNWARVGMRHTIKRFEVAKLERQRLEAVVGGPLDKVEARCWWVEKKRNKEKFDV